MNKLIYLFTLILLITACSKDDSSIAERNTVTNSETIGFEELIILVNIKATDSTYLVVESIDSVNLFINNSFWAKINSQSIDTSQISKQNINNQFETDRKVNYLIVAEQDIEEPDYTTAGDFSQYLNSFFELEPGEYVCLIESFKVTLIDGSVKKYYPLEYAHFRVEQDSKSAFIGEIELNIN